MRVLSVILFLIGSDSLKLYHVLVPHYKLDGQDAVLECKFELGTDNLYAVKWYKDNEEFFRYVPRFKPEIYVHPLEGVNVDIQKSTAKSVTLKSVDLRSTGVYRCEVSAEAPSFASDSGEGILTVVQPPKEGPQITGIAKEEYEVGEILDLNCTSSKSWPPAKMSWFINDIPVEEVPRILSFKDVLPYGESGDGRSLVGHSLESTLHLQLKLSDSHFGSKGSAKIRCVASISTHFWQDGDEKIVGNSYSRKGGRNHHVNYSDRDFSSDSNDFPAYTGNHREHHHSALPISFNKTIVLVRASASHSGNQWQLLLALLTLIAVSYSSSS